MVQRTAKGSQSIDRYVIRRVLGTGAMGSVYAAWDPKLCREVALKVVPRELATNPKTRARFLREARAIAAVRHPNIIEIYDYSGDASAHLYLVIEKLDGQDLFHLVQRTGPLPEMVALAVAHELCLALAAAHAKGIVHRDLKPENVFITASGRVVLTDFGIVKAITRSSAIDGFKEPTEIIGTPGFMAPEQLRAGHLGPGVDIFALGVMLFSLVTGEMPFVGRSPFEIFHAAAQGAYRDPRALVPELGDAFAELVAACLQPDPAARPRSADALRARLRQAIDRDGPVDLRDALAAFAADPGGAGRRRADARSIARVAERLKAALSGSNREAREQLKVRLALVAPEHPLVALAIDDGGEPTVVDGAAPAPRHGAPRTTRPTGLTPRAGSWRGVWGNLPAWMRALAASVVALSVSGGVGLGLWARQAALDPPPLQLAVIRPAPPPRAHAAAKVSVDFGLSGPPRAVRLDGRALGRLEVFRADLVPGVHRLEVGRGPHVWSRTFTLPQEAAHASVEVDVLGHRLVVSVG